MALNFADRLLTIVVTATLTSAAWVVAGSGISWDRATPSPAASPGPAPVAPPAHPAVAAAPAPAATDALVIPVEGVAPGQLTDTFADARAGGGRLHEALDIMAPAGSPVVSAAPGTVEKMFLSDAGGNTIYVRSPDRRTIYYYAHLQAYQPGLAEGQQVSAGQLLGTVGSSGNADPAAPHLHFAIMQTTTEAAWWDPATAINPYPLLVRRPQ
jgi:murein DD-endopeptidase MepM/ murein hydrolase activator NlpD